MSRIKRPIYSFDFETIVNEQETRVWLWGASNIYTESFYYGNDIYSFIERFKGLDCVGYFHNIKFDIQFIFYWLFHNGYNHTSERYPRQGYFNTLISDMGVFYSVKIHFIDGGTMELFDSYKLIPMKVEEIPKAFGLEMKKLDLDYDLQRDINHIPTDEEIEYVKHDVLIVAKAIKQMKERGMVKMTAASNALHNYKSRLEKKEFERMYPQLTIDVDKDCRKAYKGGWTYLNPNYKDIKLGIGRVYDVNSMYPWAMKYCALPWGDPLYYEGEPTEDKVFPLFIHCFKCKFKLKPGKYPSIQIKNSMRFADTEYLVDSNNEDVLMYVTSIDYKLVLDNYDVWDVEHYGGYRFRQKVGMFAEYIDFWYEQKAEHKHSGNMAMYYVAKLMLNSLYGKFGSNPEKRSKYPYLDEETDVVKYEYGMYEITKTAYVPVAAFITSYCRDKIIRTAIACGDRFVYADTDSIHIVGDEEPNIDIDDYRLGAFKLESTFQEAKFHRAKCYIESINGELEKKCAGLPKQAKELFNFDSMEVGNVFKGKLVPKNIKGGVVLVERDFTIK